MAATYDTEAYLLDDVNCNGNEGSLLECDHNKMHNCRGDESVGVICIGIYTCSLLYIHHFSVTGTIFFTKTLERLYSASAFFQIRETLVFV